MNINAKQAAKDFIEELIATGQASGGREIAIATAAWKNGYDTATAFVIALAEEELRGRGNND